jgi:hypothetical protein
MTAPQLVSVLWEDACCLDHGETWVPTPETPPVYAPVLITTVGFLLHQSDEGLIITGAWSADRTGPRDQIPRGMVRSVTFLEPVKAKRERRG